ncbi:DUF1249 domain-containing protein [Rickettsiella endosymbiont of Dermanyssus gallinae]|uniref:DUF1249 domain-containing protein n=1 Tax=Rickettsiella endosymbiont of Dermanyssus gallinae TaxID=2856608 RepID=UPI001C52819B|nr:DUF1249 domain-containing protein [Rickettsiella endosymbiont of Dermanyssus gallinae]
MANSTANDIYSRIYKNLIKLIPDIEELELGDGLISCSIKPMSMDLHLDVLKRNEEKIIISLAHYYKTEWGDFAACIDMQICILLKKHMAEVLAYQDRWTYQRVYVGNRVYPKRKKEFNSYLNQWLRDCLKQGHCLKQEKEVNHG